MKKRKIVLMFALTLLISGVKVQAKEVEEKYTFKSYVNLFLEEVKGTKKESSDSDLETSIQELVEDINPEDAKKILEFVKEKIEEGKWESRQGTEEAILEGEEKFGASLTKKQKELILSVVEKIKKLGIDPDYLVEQAEKILEKYSGDLQQGIQEGSQKIVHETQNKIKEEIKYSLTDYFSDMVSNVKSFFKGFFKK